MGRGIIDRPEMVEETLPAGWSLEAVVDLEEGIHSWGNVLPYSGESAWLPSSLSGSCSGSRTSEMEGTARGRWPAPSHSPLACLSYPARPQSPMSRSGASPSTQSTFFAPGVPEGGRHSPD